MRVVGTKDGHVQSVKNGCGANGLRTQEQEIGSVLMEKGDAGMRIMSERRFQKELEKVREELYQKEQADRRIMEIENRISEIQRELFYLRCKVEGQADTCETNTGVQR